MKRQNHFLYRIEYVWIDADKNLRSKSRIINIIDNEKSPDIVNNIDLIPIWNFDGSSTGQAPGINSEVYLRPVKVYNNPFIKTNVFYTNQGFWGGDFLVLCETINDDLETSHESNTRTILCQTYNNENIISENPWFGFEMEFFMINPKSQRPLGFPETGLPVPPEQGKFYCGNGASNCFGRNIMNDFYDYCLIASINIVGINAEVACGQWEYQIFGDTMNATDDAWMSKYILNRVAENYNVDISWNPKIYRDCNGSGMHTNFSTKSMRNENGLDEILKVMPKLEKYHHQHLENYGNNDKRLTGEHETSSKDTFSWGFADRGRSIRIGKMTQKNKKGYLEDRRPASDCDMYLVANELLQTVFNRE